MQQLDAHAAGRRPWFALAPGVGLAVLAKFSCSLCVSVYAGLLSSVGLGFVATEGGFLGLTVFLLALGTGSIAWSARRHGHWGPLLLAGGGALLVLVGRLQLTTPALYVGTGAMAAAALWNLWLARRPARSLVPLAPGESIRNRPGRTP